MSHIKVCCRVRPIDQSVDQNCIVLNATDDTDGRRCYKEVVIGGQNFQLDNAFSDSVTQAEVFEEIVQPMIQDSFTGFNCSLFSYGQTGSGKTHTLIGSLDMSDEMRGVIPRSAEMIFRIKRSIENTTTCSINFSIIEIYQEKLKDLLSGHRDNGETPGNNKSSSSLNNTDGGSQLLRIREHIDGTVWVEGLTEVLLQREDDFVGYLSAAMKKRVVGKVAVLLRA